MMKPKSRAMRQAQKKRIKEWAIRMAKRQMARFPLERGREEAIVANWVARAEHPQCCSKRCCGNQRKHEGITIQERRQDDG